MKDIRITPAAQIVAVGALVAVSGAAFAAQLPELKRYLNMKKM